MVSPVTEGNASEAKYSLGPSKIMSIYLSDTLNTTPLPKKIHGFSIDELSFDLVGEEEADLPEDEKRELLPGQLDDQFLPSDLPYLKAPLLKPISNNVPERAGSVKYLMTVSQ